MSSNLVTLRCPACNAPFPAGSSYKSEIKCPYCGHVTFNHYAVGQQSDTSISIMIPPDLTEKSDDNWMKDLIWELVYTDYVPIDVFDSFNIESIRHNMYPVYVFNVNWSANWSAVFSHKVSHEEPSYDLYGKRTGTKTVVETEYRDANGTSAGDCRVVLSGLMEGFPIQSEICESYAHLDSEQEINGMDGRVVELLRKGEKLAAVKLYNEISGFGLELSKEIVDDYLNSKSIDPKMSEIQIIDILEVERDKLNGWELIEPNLSREEAWKRGGKDIVDADVEHGVTRDLRSMSAGWIVDSRNYTYRYSEGIGRCVLLPIWEADYRYADNVYLASVDSWIGDVHWEDYPKDEKVEELKEKTDEKISWYKGLRTAGYVFFGIFSALTILFLALPSFSENRIVFCAMLVLAIVSWVLTRLAQRKKLKLENKLMNKLWDDKLIRSEAAERRFGIKVNIGEEPKKQTLEFWVDIIVYVIFGIVFFISITQGLFADINRYHHTRTQSNYQSSTTTNRKSKTSSSYHQPTNSTRNSGQQTVGESSEIRIQGNASDSPHNNASIKDNCNVVIDGTELRLRLGPSTNADTFKWGDGSNRHPNKGEKYRYLGESGDFYKIDYKGHELWVSKQYTHLEDNSGSNAKLLRVINVESSSNLAPQAGNTYNPSNLCDGNGATAWAIDLDEAIYDDYMLSGPIFTVKCKNLSHIIIRNGYCKNDDSYRNNTRAAKIVFYNPDCYDGCILFDGSLRDTSTPQRLEISSNIEGNNNIMRIGMDFYTQNNGGFYTGAKWNDLCISEVEFWGYE